VARLNVCLFGKLSPQYNGEELAGFDPRETEGLLCYPLLHSDHPHSREVLASLLWDDDSTNPSKKDLRHTLWQLQSALGLGRIGRNLRAARGRPARLGGDHVWPSSKH
jgi:DNA-binding SARP family transcriptional activator